MNDAELAARIQQLTEQLNIALRTAAFTNKLRVEAKISSPVRGLDGTVNVRQVEVRIYRELIHADDAPLVQPAANGRRNDVQVPA